MTDNMEKYLESFRRLYTQRSHETEKGRDILERKARVLNLNAEDCHIAIENLLSRYAEYTGLLVDIQTHGGILESDMVELSEFQSDLALTDEEVQFLSEALSLGREAEGTAIVDQTRETEREAEPTNLIVKSIPLPEVMPTGTELLQLLDAFGEAKESDAFFYLFMSQAVAAKETFISVLGDINSAQQIDGNLLLNLYRKSFEGFLKTIHGAMVRGGFEGTPVESLWVFLDPGGIKSIGDEFAQIAAGMEEIIEADRLQRKYGRGASARLAVGSLGFMAAMGLIGAAGKGLRSLGDAAGNTRLASKLNSRALAGFRSAIMAIEEIIDLGLERLYDAIAVSLGMRDYADIQRDHAVAQNILEQYVDLKQSDGQLYGAKALAALCYNPFHARAYCELADCIENDTELELAVLRKGMEHALFGSDKKILQSKVSALEHVNSIANLTETDLEQIAAIAKPLQEFAASTNAGQKPNDFVLIEEDDEQLLRLVSVVERYNEENLDPTAVLAYGEFPRSSWLFTYTRFYALYDGKLVSSYYHEVQDYSASGWTNTYVKLRLRDGFHEVPMTGNNAAAAAEPVLQFIRAAREYTQTFLIGLRGKDTVITQALQTSNVEVDNLLSKALERADVARKLVRLQHVEPAEFYRRTWEAVSKDGYPSAEQLEWLTAVAAELGLKPDRVLELQRPSLDRYYEEELGGLEKQKPGDLKEVLLSIRSKYQVRDVQAVLAEKKHFGMAITVAPGKTSFVEEALARFDQLGVTPFGSRLFRTGSIPSDKLTNARLKYLRCSDDEILLFLYDETLFGSAKDGLAITDKAIYSSDSKAMQFSSMLTTKLRSSSLIIGGKDGEFSAGLSMMGDSRQAFLDFVTQLARIHKRTRAEFGDW